MIASLTPLGGRAAEIGSWLAQHLPWTPHDFVPGISLQGDRELRAAFLTRELAAEDDMRLLARDPQGREVVVCAERLPWDSEFFGHGVARLNGVHALSSGASTPPDDHTYVLKKLTDLSRQRGVRYLFAPVDSRDLTVIRSLCQAGFTLIETRLCYHRHIADEQGPDKHVCRLARAEDVESLGRAARECVNPFDRFHADPFLDREKVDALMSRWVAASILEGFANATIVPDRPSPSAFCTLRYHRDCWTHWGIALGQVALVAVSDEFRGWFKTILAEGHEHMRKAGVGHMLLVTQAANKAMIQIMEKSGYHLGRVEHIFRIIL